MNYTDLDALVQDYLYFRKFSATAKNFQNERDGREAFEEDDQIPAHDPKSDANIRDAIMAALETSESLRLLTLWDTHVTKDLDNVSPETIAEARIAEFYLHLFCATHPFRDDVLQTLTSPGEAAKCAARAMTIFRHFTETRGRRLLKTSEFQRFRNLHKIAFPPTHPTYSYMFRKEWQTKTRDHVAMFLEKFFRAKQAPQLVVMLNKVSQCEEQESLMLARENEIRTVFRKREEKLMDFSRSIYSISNDLLNAIDSGGELNQEFLYKFRLKFDEFHEVLGADAPPPTRLHPAARRKKKRVKRKEPHFKELEYSALVDDFGSMANEVGTELNSLTKPDKVLSVIDVEMATASSLQGGAILNALLEYVTRDRDDTSNGPGAAKPSPPTAEGIRETQRTAAKIFMQEDIFGLMGSTLPGALPSGEEGAAQAADSSSYVISFLRVFGSSAQGLCARPYSREISDRVKHKSISDNMENHFGELYESSSSLAYSICRLLANVSVRLSLEELLTVTNKEEMGAGLHALYDVLVDVLIGLPNNTETKKTHKNINDLVVVLLVLLVTLSPDRKHKLTIVKKGLMEWLAATLSEIVERADDSGAILKEDEDTFLLSVALINCVVESSEAYRAVVASSRALTACQKIFQLLVSNVLFENKKINLGDRQLVLHRISLRSVNSIVSEKVVREALKQDYEELVRLLQQCVGVHANAPEPSPPDVELNEKRLISKHIVRVTGGDSGNTDVVNVYADASALKSVAQSISFLQEVFTAILSSLPLDENAIEYAAEHPKQIGLPLLVPYSKAYREEHGSYETSEHVGEDDEEEDDDNTTGGIEDDELLAIDHKLLVDP